MDLQRCAYCDNYIITDNPPEAGGKRYCTWVCLNVAQIEEDEGATTKM